VVLDSGKDGGEQYGYEGEECGEGGRFGKTVKGAWKRADPRDDRDNCREANRAHGVARHGVEVLGAYQAVEALVSVRLCLKDVYEVVTMMKVLFRMNMTAVNQKAQRQL
jgi:hypothetical protein